MRSSRSAALVVLAMMGAGFAAAQQPEAAAQPVSHGIYWSFDPIHGVIQPLGVTAYAVPGKPTSSPVPEAPTGTKTYTGTIDINVTINLISTLHQGAALRCSGAVSLEYEISSTGPLVISALSPSSSGESVDATISGNTATCKFTIPYSWAIPASTSTTKYTINGIGGAVGIAADQINADGAVVRTYRSTTVELVGPTTVPQDGTTTTLTASTVL